MFSARLRMFELLVIFSARLIMYNMGAWIAQIQMDNEMSEPQRWKQGECTEVQGLERHIATKLISRISICFRNFQRSFTSNSN